MRVHHLFLALAITLLTVNCISCSHAANSALGADMSASCEVKRMASTEGSITAIPIQGSRPGVTSVVVWIAETSEGEYRAR